MAAYEFDADAYRAAIQRPTLVIDGHRYTGVVISIEQYLALSGVLAEVQTVYKQAESLTTEQVIERYKRMGVLCRQVCDVLFPKPWWAVWRRSAGARLAKASLTTQVGALARFLGWITLETAGPTVASDAESPASSPSA